MKVLLVYDLFLNIIIVNVTTIVHVQNVCV